MKTKMWGKKLLGALETKVSCLRTFINKVEDTYNFHVNVHGFYFLVITNLNVRDKDFFPKFLVRVNYAVNNFKVVCLLF